ncbi:MAG TPA: type II toxin-antitoxin system prevent-host-death family antitoxin [Pseudomonas sp.]|uniref:type II toxin-antitoxin system prevent-host-death family antitoxin n=1 Tax=Pseudomonas TaxID=286 RepID=UPI0020A0CB7C|nr:type II toxin-antitoxin system prevent-host-death family antitoxin [Pseudomonas sp.]HWH87383.1 type II toxin-antitoxin system prevent-host-death family antitoxin [Pseudomonas sp.]
MQRVFADMAVSISELKKNPSAVLKGANAGAVAILNHNRVMGYMVSADVYEALVERLDDLELMQIARSRDHETPMPVNLHDL